MTKPRTVVEIAFNAGYTTAASSRTWTDVTGYVFAQSSIDITHARQDEFSQPGPNTCRLTLDNRDGRFTPGLSTGAYYPNVKVGRPLRVSVQMCTHGDFGTFEAGATGWSGSNATVSRSTLQAHSGSAALLVTASSAGDMFAFCPAAMSAIPVAPSETYRASAWFRRAGTARTTDLRVVWFDSVGATISTSTSPTITDSTTWQQISFEVTAPSNAAFAQIRPFWASANEGHYVDDIFFGCDRFTGYIDEWPLEWPHTVSTYATSTITASSRMARGGLSAKLASLITLELPELDHDDYDELSAVHTDWSLKGTGAVPTFSAADGVALTDNLPMVSFAGGKFLRQESWGVSSWGVALVTTQSGYFVSARRWIVDSAGTVTDRFSTRLRVTSDGVLEYTLEDNGVVTSTLTGTTVVNDGRPHSIAYAGDGSTERIYIDGTLEISAVFVEPNEDFTLGGAVDDDGTVLTPSLTGHLGRVVGYATDHADAAACDAWAALYDEVVRNGFQGESAADRLARYAGYAGIPSAEHSISSLAATPMAHIDTTEKGAVELMQTVATTDGGVLYDGRNGVLTYVDRTVRYNATARADLYVSDGDVEVGYSPKVDRSALVNKLTATLSDGTYSVTAENTTSTTEYGAHGPGDLELATTSQDEAHAAAWWRVNTYGEPSARVPQVGAELAKMTAARQAEILAVDVSDKITVNDLPSQSDASAKGFFVEGCTETITASQHFVTFNVSPTTGFDVWEVEHATYGQYDAYPIAY